MASLRRLLQLVAPRRRLAHSRQRPAPTLSSNGMDGVKKWGKFNGGAFNVTPRRADDWMYSGIDKANCLMLDSNNRLSARRQELQRSASPSQQRSVSPSQ